ncbi:hypothetical protein L249_4535, partial [Ophiocordyceps polyrhachis-furcata BCC 54312]
MTLLRRSKFGRAGPTTAAPHHDICGAYVSGQRFTTSVTHSFYCSCPPITAITTTTTTTSATSTASTTTILQITPGSTLLPPRPLQFTEARQLQAAIQRKDTFVLLGRLAFASTLTRSLYTDAADCFFNFILHESTALIILPREDELLSYRPASHSKIMRSSSISPAEQTHPWLVALAGAWRAKILLFPPRFLKAPLAEMILDHLQPPRTEGKGTSSTVVLLEALAGHAHDMILDHLQPLQKKGERYFCNLFGQSKAHDMILDHLQPPQPQGRQMLTCHPRAPRSRLGQSRAHDMILDHLQPLRNPAPVTFSGKAHDMIPNHLHPLVAKGKGIISNHSWLRGK